MHNFVRVILHICCLGCGEQRAVEAWRIFHTYRLWSRHTRHTHIQNHHNRCENRLAVFVRYGRVDMADACLDFGISRCTQSRCANRRAKLCTLSRLFSKYVLCISELYSCGSCLQSSMFIYKPQFSAFIKSIR